MIPVDLPPTDLGDDDDDQQREEELRRECQARPRLDRLNVYKQGYIPGALCRFIGIWPDQPIPSHVDLFVPNTQPWVLRPDIIDETILKRYLGQICTIWDVFHIGRERPYLLKLLFSDGATTVIEDEAVQLFTTLPGLSSNDLPQVTG